MKTFVSWGGVVYRDFFLEPVTADSSVVEGTIDVSGAGVIGVFRFHPLLSYYANHENNCKLVGSPVMEVFVRDKIDEQPRAVLTCEDDDGPLGPANPSMVRGTAIFCEITAPGGSTVQPTRWRFTSTGGGITVDRPATEVGETVWSGTMVTSGTITVEAKVGGRQVEPLQASVTVVPRKWNPLTYPQEPQPVYLGEPDFPYPPDRELPSGEGSSYESRWGHFKSAGLSFKGQRGDGPNDGFSFVTGVQFGALAIELNRALKPDDPFYQAQRPDPRRIYSQPPCDQAFMAHAATFVLAHEREHYRIAKEFFESAETASALEALIAYNADRSVLPDINTDSSGAELQRRQDAFDAGSKLRITCVFLSISGR
jgi:hypothetical protein